MDARVAKLAVDIFRPMFSRRKNSTNTISFLVARGGLARPTTLSINGRVGPFHLLTKL